VDLPCPDDSNSMLGTVSRDPLYLDLKLQRNRFQCEQRTICCFVCVRASYLVLAPSLRDPLRAEGISILTSSEKNTL
jgi:hypothetical protein